jgi:ubiquinol-cytochrome c reductase cytochrome c1 subunit
MKGYMRLHNIVFIFLMLLSATASAAGGAKLMHMEVDLSDRESLQRGAATFVNYCLSCHSAAYMRYNRMGKDLGISDNVLKTNFMFGTDKVGDTMTIAMNPADADSFFGVIPPDLSVIARARGADWLYTYFKTFYVDDSRPFGVNNLAFKDVGMPHVLWKLQGAQRLTKVDHGDGKHHAPTYKDLELISHGSQSEEKYDQTVRDLVNFMVYLGEPVKLKRSKIGVWVLLYLFVFMIITYLLKKEYWRDVH